MSHLAHRKETNCLNCGTTVIGAYCHVCGQENLEPKESLWHLVLHFFNDVTHFDGKFFSSLKDVLLKPGFLSKEYMNGRRASYLNPIRMYLFTSFIFFLVFFSAYHFPAEQLNKEVITIKGQTEKQVDALSQKDFEDFTRSINNGNPMSRSSFKEFVDSLRGNGISSLFNSETGVKYKNNKQYDSLIRSGKLKNNRLTQFIIHKEMRLNEKYNGDSAKFMQDFSNSLMHHFPQMLFVSLPLIAFLLKLLYVRHQRFYYVSHAIFTVHFYIFIFIVLLIEIGINKLYDLLNWNWLNAINNLLGIIIFFYLYKAMRKFYEQGRWKTLLKYFLFIFSGFFLIVLVFVLFAFISVFQI